jgi:thioredoxin 2
MSKTLHLVCPHCGSINRLPPDRPPLEGRCGKCRKALFTGRPLILDAAGFERHLRNDSVPLLVDFWAAWCGPCKMMAPIFERAAAELEPRVRLAKIDTDKEQMLAGRLGIRGIPTLILFDRGEEVARTSGVMDQRSLVQWVTQQL